MHEPYRITADEVNCLIHAYFEDSGFQHSAFVLRAEGRLEHSPNIKKHVARGELVELLSKALLYSEVEAHWKGNVTTTNCKSTFSILEKHVCAPDPELPATRTYEAPPESIPIFDLPNGTSEKVEKRKADTPALDEGPKGKRARTEEFMDVDSIASSLAPTKVSTPLQNTTNDDASTNAVTILNGHTADVFVCKWNPVDINKVASGSKDAVINIWTIPDTPGADGQLHVPPPATLAYMLGQEEQTDLTCLDWNPDGTILSAGSYDRTLRVCSSSSQLYFSSLQHKGAIFATQFSKSGKWLLSGSLDGTVCLWDVPRKKLFKQFHCHDDCCLDVDWITDEIFASCGADQNIQIRRIDSDTPLKTVKAHSGEVNQIKCNPSHTRLASCSDDQTARIWIMEDLMGRGDPEKSVKVLRGHTGQVSSIIWCPKTAIGANEICATSSYDGTVRLWDAVTGQCTLHLSDYTCPVFALSFCPDGRLFATGAGDGWMYVYDVKTHQRRWSWYTGKDGDRPPAIFEIDWQHTGNVNRMIAALECGDIGIIDVARIPSLR
ncbi:F-box-like/WD repeat-containing protein Ebi-like protein [Abortiporus biennis]